jgi:ribosome-binding protein aMBF1 (putative translation factor)
MASTDITTVWQDTSRMGRRRVSLAARGVGTRLISQPLTDRTQPATLTISRRSAGVMTSSPRQRVAQADTTSRLAADYDNRIGRRPS